MRHLIPKRFLLCIYITHKQATSTHLYFRCFPTFSSVYSPYTDSLPWFRLQSTTVRHLPHIPAFYNVQAPNTKLNNRLKTFSWLVISKALGSSIFCVTIFFALALLLSIIKRTNGHPLEKPSHYLCPVLIVRTIQTPSLFLQGASSCTYKPQVRHFDVLYMTWFLCRSSWK